MVLHKQHGTWVHCRLLGSVWCSYIQEELEVCLFLVCLLHERLGICGGGNKVELVPRQFEESVIGK